MPMFHILDRCYCGHEHLLDHGIINMNGRIYDPIVGQFMQAYNFVQSPEDYISYNRYAYCRYNPFKYTDPSGEHYLELGELEGRALIAAENARQDAMFQAICYAMRGIDPNENLTDEIARKNLSKGGGGGGGTNTGNISQGVYLTGTPDEMARMALTIGFIIGDIVIYDNETGEILGRLGLDKGLETNQYTELRDCFDQLIENAEKSGKTISMGFGEESSEFSRKKGSSKASIVFSNSFLNSDYSKLREYPTTESNNTGLESAHFGQIIAHELFGHGLDFVSDYKSLFMDWQSDWEARAIKRENYFAYILGKPFRHH